MAILEIIKDGNSLLTKKSKPVKLFDESLFKLFDDMKETMTNAQGVGLAAVQVGVPLRAFVIDTGEQIIEFANPEIMIMRGNYDDTEGCLSLPNVFGIVKRPKYVKVKAFTRNGEPFEFEGEDLMARAVCHENDHLNGKMFTEKVIKYIDTDKKEEGNKA